jgi:hypothetical protein
LPELQELDLMNAPRLARFELNDRAKLIAFEAAGCRKLRVDWERLRGDLEYLSYAGRNGFSLDEIRVAAGLRFVMLTKLSGKVDLEVLKDLPDLSAVSLVSLNAPKPAREIVKSINAGHGHGEVLLANPPLPSNGKS